MSGFEKIPNFIPAINYITSAYNSLSSACNCLRNITKRILNPKRNNTKIFAIINQIVIEILTLDDDYLSSELHSMPTTFVSHVVFAFSMFNTIWSHFDKIIFIFERNENSCDFVLKC